MMILASLLSFLSDQKKRGFFSLKYEKVLSYGVLGGSESSSLFSFIIYYFSMYNVADTHECHFPKEMS